MHSILVARFDREGGRAEADQEYVLLRGSPKVEGVAFLTEFHSMTSERRTNTQGMENRLRPLSPRVRFWR
jgi:hypothetical protein